MRRYILTLTLAAMAFAASHGQTKRMAVIGFSESYLREQPAYTAELGTQALMGSVVEIVAEEGYWKQVVTSEPYTAWCTDLGLVEMKHDRLAAYIAAQHGKERGVNGGGPDLGPCDGMHRKGRDDRGEEAEAIRKERMG